MGMMIKSLYTNFYGRVWSARLLQTTHSFPQSHSSLLSSVFLDKTAPPLSLQPMPKTACSFYSRQNGQPTAHQWPYCCFIHNNSILPPPQIAPLEFVAFGGKRSAHFHREFAFLNNRILRPMLDKFVLFYCKNFFSISAHNEFGRQIFFSTNFSPTLWRYFSEKKKVSTHVRGGSRVFYCKSPFHVTMGNQALEFPISRASLP